MQTTYICPDRPKLEIERGRRGMWGLQTTHAPTDPESRWRALGRRGAMESTCTAVGQLADNAVGLLAPFGFRQQLRSKAALPRRSAVGVPPLFGSTQQLCCEARRGTASSPQSRRRNSSLTVSCRTPETCAMKLGIERERQGISPTDRR